MKHIRKQGASGEYLRWCREVRGTNHEDYRRLGNPLKAELHRTLLTEQGYLCAYTMKRIDAEASHIEHIKPEALCRADRTGSDLEYTNLVACFPAEGMKGRYRYGAQLKDDWWEDGGFTFVSPLHPACESRFRFGLDGGISAVNNHPKAVTTIRVLGLDHCSLTEDRKRVIDEFIFGPTGNTPLSKAQAARAITGLSHRNGEGHFREFCVAISHALEAYRKTLARNARRRWFARRRG